MHVHQLATLLFKDIALQLDSYMFFVSSITQFTPKHTHTHTLPHTHTHTHKHKHKHKHKHTHTHTHTTGIGHNSGEKYEAV